MSRILAVEPDHDCGRALKHLIGTWVDAEVVVVESAHAALTAIAEFGPDVVLVSALISPADDVTITSRVKDLPAGRDLPILSIPAVVDGYMTPPERRGGPLSLFARRPLLPWPAYDAEVLAVRVRDALRQSQQTGINRQQLAEQLVASGVPAQAAGRPAGAGRSVGVQELSLEDLVADAGLSGRRARAPRWKGPNVPWLTTVTMPLGLEVRLLNISRSGLLIESRSDFIVGQPTEFELHGPTRQVLASGRFVRTRATASPGHALRYQAAAVFDREVRLFGAHAPQPRAADDAQSDLAGVLAWVRREAQAGLQHTRIRSAFELGVQQLVGARDVRVCDEPVVTEAPGESFCFTVPTHDDSNALLQAIYDPGRPPARAAFEVLRAAAAMAADVLEIEAASRSAGEVSFGAR